MGNIEACCQNSNNYSTGTKDEKHKRSSTLRQTASGIKHQNIDQFISQFEQSSDNISQKNQIITQNIQKSTLNQNIVQQQMKSQEQNVQIQQMSQQLTQLQQEISKVKQDMIDKKLDSPIRREHQKQASRDYKHEKDNFTLQNKLINSERQYKKQEIQEQKVQSQIKKGQMMQDSSKNINNEKQNLLQYNQENIIQVKQEKKEQKLNTSIKKENKKQDVPKNMNNQNENLLQKTKENQQIKQEIKEKKQDSPKKEQKEQISSKEYIGGSEDFSQQNKSKNNESSQKTQQLNPSEYGQESQKDQNFMKLDSNVKKQVIRTKTIPSMIEEEYDDENTQNIQMDLDKSQKEFNLPEIKNQTQINNSMSGYDEDFSNMGNTSLGKKKKKKGSKKKKKKGNTDTQSVDYSQDGSSRRVGSIKKTITRKVKISEIETLHNISNE